MKKITTKQHFRDVRLGLKNRNKHISKKRKFKGNKSTNKTNGVCAWLDENIERGLLNAIIDKNNRVQLILPEKMNLSDKYETTMLYITAIRKLAEINGLSNRFYRLSNVRFELLEDISTSAALVLTAELSKWDDTIRQRLRPDISSWNCVIIEKFKELGFFDLFQNNPLDDISKDKKDENCSTIKLVKYIKGKCGDSKKTRELKKGIRDIVGENIEKWTFLHSGLTEAITNVSHHAYPNTMGYKQSEKYWYLTGAYNSISKEIKIVFYDQGIGIPKSLPASVIWEKVLKMMKKWKIPMADRKNDETLLKAAVEYDRTSTGDSDRGKGLQDLLEFVKQRKNGYLSILSLKGLYKYSVKDGVENIKTVHFKNEISGTLIIWSAILA